MKNIRRYSVLLIFLWIGNHSYAKDVRFGMTLGLGGGTQFREEKNAFNEFVYCPYGTLNTSLTMHFLLTNNILINTGFKAVILNYSSFSGTLGIGKLYLIKKTPAIEMLLGGTVDINVGYDILSDAPTLGIEGSLYLTYNKLLFGFSLGYDQTPSYQHTEIFYGYKSFGVLNTTIRMGFLL